MGLTSLLLLASLLTAPLAAADTLQGASSSAQVRAAEDLAAEVATAKDEAGQFAFARKGDDIATDADGICYKIRAYIFKRDDDHAPELTGTTTCGPKQPRAKDVVSPGARLVPAN